VAAPALEPDADPVAADRAPDDRDAVYVAAGDADPDEAGRDRIAALQGHSGEIEPGP
jgi:hypothetical protein